ncbi:MAG: 5-formyltetrahydrofolate cyclo-ligase [Prevotella sp.]|nr:5-formyltetrahydrofolate cyclo-ligase [Prevotella sp.]
MNKAELRAEIRRRYKRTTDTERHIWSEEICERLLGDERLRRAKCIMMFSPLGDEPDISAVGDALLAMGKTVLLPEVTDGENMVLRRYNGRSDLREGMFGILEPKGEVFASYGDIDYVLVPGVAFTLGGQRLGRGKGYYDRFLPRVGNAFLRGVCFPYQIVEGIPTDVKDMDVDYV